MLGCGEAVEVVDVAVREREREIEVLDQRRTGRDPPNADELPSEPSPKTAVALAQPRLRLAATSWTQSLVLAYATLLEPAERQVGRGLVRRWPPRKLQLKDK